jgi:hypothetical protein
VFSELRLEKARQRDAILKSRRESTPKSCDEAGRYFKQMLDDGVAVERMMYIQSRAGLERLLLKIAKKRLNTSGSRPMMVMRTLSTNIEFCSLKVIMLNRIWSTRRSISKWRWIKFGITQLSAKVSV